jgi:2-hydroxy-3-keto-5-methylthiopentenyl-1-phosphate phosphatase
MTGQRWAVACDFDGTATVEDLADLLSIRYIGLETWTQVNAAYQRGAITFEALIQAMFVPIAASPDELRTFVAEHATFRPGFERLVRWCRSHAVPFLLVSGGLENYIRPALALLPDGIGQGIPVLANRLDDAPDGRVLSMPLRDAPGACGTCGSCKGTVVRDLQAQGYRVLALGDGNADRCMAGGADLLYARGRLLEWCRREHVPCEAFDGLDPVVDRLDTLVNGTSPQPR